MLNRYFLGCFLYFLLFLSSINSTSQELFSRKDSLHGGMRKERSCYDVQRYNLKVKIQPEIKLISGCNEIVFLTTSSTSRIQLDLYANMVIDSIVHKKETVKYTREFNAVFLNFSKPIARLTKDTLKIYYSGNPIEAQNAPWDGGFVWKKDSKGNPWIGVAVQGIGASVWFPCKDSQTDEPDSGTSISISVPNNLIAVSNGRFVSKKINESNFTEWNWEVKNPINSYDITVNIGDYSHIHKKHLNLDLDFYVLKENQEKAKLHFKDVYNMLNCFESKFGDYPFLEDGYKLVETPYLGMEHQSAISYGNQYKKGYLGEDLSGTELGLLFDFIIVHESGHEWFGNSITSKDIADMWIHESFTCYSESVYVECMFGTENGQKYVNGLKKNVLNDKPILGTYNVQNRGSGDMYYKGALMLNTIRNIINDDEKWWNLLRNFALKFRHQIIDKEIVVSYFSNESEIDLVPVFYQYLKHIEIPVLEVKKQPTSIVYRWVTNEAQFQMPFDIEYKDATIRINPTQDWKEMDIEVESLNEITFLTNRFYVDIKVVE